MICSGSLGVFYLIMTEQELIREAKVRGYKKGVAIKYVEHATDYVEGDFFEMDEYGNLNAYSKPQEERKKFDDNTHDTLYNASNNAWVELAGV